MKEESHWDGNKVGRNMTRLLCMEIFGASVRIGRLDPGRQGPRPVPLLGGSSKRRRLDFPSTQNATHFIMSSNLVYMGLTDK